MGDMSAGIRTHQHAARCQNDSLHLSLPVEKTHLQGDLGAAEPLCELCHPLLSSDG